MKKIVFMENCSAVIISIRIHNESLALRLSAGWRAKEPTEHTARRQEEGIVFGQT